VDAPEGTEALPNMAVSVITSTSRVGLPRESNIWRASTDAIKLILWVVFE
jgi:hypothetical protein